ncbi:MAG TPA: DUF3828 domain-containing protein [Candidatus Baltobacteraceae bacterium]|jgi:hypothetical protein
MQADSLSSAEATTKGIIRKLLTLFAAIAFLASGITFAVAQPSDATRVVSSFYTWYFAHQKNWTNLSKARQYLTPSLYASLEKVLEEEQKTHASAFDYSPFDYAQEYAQSYSTGTPSGNATTISIPVRLRFSYSKVPSTIHVILVRGSGGWKIDNFVYPDNVDLRHTLQSIR